MPLDYLMSLPTDRGDVVAGIAAGLVLIVLVLGRKFNWFGSVESVTGKPSEPKKSDLAVQVDRIDHRLKQVEADIEHLPTRQEFHQMALQLSQLEGHVRMVERTATATGHAVGRIEDHFIRMSGGK